MIETLESLIVCLNFNKNIKVLPFLSLKKITLIYKMIFDCNEEEVERIGSSVVVQ